MGMTTEEIHARSKIDPWFLHNIQEIIAIEDRLRACPGLDVRQHFVFRPAFTVGPVRAQSVPHVYHREDARG